MPPLRTLLAALLAALLLLPAASAQANDTQFSVMMDDDLLLYRGDDVRDRALQRMQDLDVDVARITILWSVVAEKARDTPAQRKRFERLGGGSNPAAYPKLNWDRYDRLVKALQRLGITPYFNVTGPGPRWAHKTAPKSARSSQATWKPKAREFYKFVQAVGKRYSGRYRDENDERGNDGKRLFLPAVKFWSIWNEPNQAGWLTPQFEGGRPASPHLYRELYDFGYRALVSTGHGGDSIFAGETAPLGSPRAPGVRTPMDPTTFVRQMFCVGDDGQATNANASCARTKWPVKMSGWAHHPYTKNRSPLQPDPDPRAITIADINELPSLLDQVAGTTGRVAAGLPILNGEFGYETNPPDPFSGISLELQANWTQLAEYLAYINPRIIGNTQFLLRDVRPRTKFKPGTKAYWFTYQSGLYTTADQPKPALRTYALPFLAFPDGSTDPATGRPNLAFWGGLKFRPDGLPPGTDEVQIQFKPADGSADWTTFARFPVTNVKGWFTGVVAPPGPGQVRAAWQGAEKPFAAVSREVAVAQ
jgi:hypothetical protein